MFLFGKIKKTMVPALLSPLLIGISGCEPEGLVLGGEDDWQVTAPEEYGLSSDKLNQAAEAIGKIVDRQCVVVIKNGTLIHETYFRGDAETRNYGYSVAKSFGGTLIGIAATQGYLSLEDKVATWVPNHSEKMNPEATVRHLLGQVSEADPVGTLFEYDSGEVVDTVSRIIEAATGQNPVAYAYEQLLEPIGIRHSSWGKDFNSRLPIGAGGNWTCRDLARLGQLYLNKGWWDGEEIVSESFIDEAIRPSHPEANTAYGYLWWTNMGEGKWYRPVTKGEGRLLPEAPETLYMATGLFGQLILVDPAQDLVITTAGTTVEVETLNTVKKVWAAISPALTP